MDEPIIQMAQMVNMNDQRIRELGQAVTLKVNIITAGRYGQLFAVEATPWENHRGEGYTGTMGSTHLRLAVALIELINLSARDNGQVTQGTALEGPIIRELEDKIASPWRPTTYGDRVNE